MFIDITDLYCLTTKSLPSSTITHTSSFVKTWRLINAIFTTHLHPYPTPSNSSFLFFVLFSPLPFSVPHGGYVIVESASSLDIVYPHERAMMALQNLLAGDGLNWCGDSGLDYERLSSSDSDTPLFPPPPTAHFGLHDLTYSFCPRPFAFRHG